MPKESSFAPARAFNAGKKFNSKNTSVVLDGYEGVKMYLFGNLIAVRNTRTGEVKVTNAGWPTNTTRDRLNALGVASFTIAGGKRKSYLSGTMYMNGTPMENGKWYTVKDGGKNSDNGFHSLAAVALMGELFGSNQKESNDWKTRMLKAGLENKGFIMPEDWNELSEDEKQRRLDGVINILSDKK